MLGAGGLLRILIQAANSSHTDSPAHSSRGDDGPDDDGRESASAIRLDAGLEDVNREVLFDLRVKEIPDMRYLYYRGEIMSSVSLRLPENLSKRLARLAKRTGRTKTYYMIEAIREHLDDLEDLYLAEQRLAAIREGRGKTVPLEVAMRKHGLEG